MSIAYSASRLSCLVVGIFCAVLAACSSVATDDAANESPLIGDDMSLPTRLVAPHEGVVLENVELHLIAWKTDPSGTPNPIAARVEGFLSWLVQSPYWSHLREYGIEAGVVADLVELPNPPAHWGGDESVLPLLESLIAANKLPPRNPRTAYVLLLPENATFPAGGAGYHGQGKGFVYAVMPVITKPRECQTPAGACDATVSSCVECRTNADCAATATKTCGPALLDFDEMTMQFSHEVAEMVTAPRATGNGPGKRSSGWYADGIWFGEIGDLCQNLSTHSLPVSLGDGTSVRYKLSRVYSNAQAALGDPCVPHVGVPELTPMPYQGVKSAPTLHLDLDANGNGSMTFKLAAFRTDPATKSVQWSAGWVNSDPHVTAAPLEGTVAVGHPATITITADHAAATGAQGLDLVFMAMVPDPGNSDWNAGVIAEWNTELTIGNK